MHSISAFFAFSLSIRERRRTGRSSNKQDSVPKGVEFVTVLVLWLLLVNRLMFAALALAEILLVSRYACLMLIICYCTYNRRDGVDE